jgi:hypothetical protein
MKRRGVQFVELTNDELSHLKYFIENHAMGEV